VQARWPALTRFLFSFAVAVALFLAPRPEPHGGLGEAPDELALSPSAPRGPAAIAFPSATATLSHDESSLKDDILGRTDPASRC
jgi:hypothetical protein